MTESVNQAGLEPTQAQSIEPAPLAEVQVERFEGTGVGTLAEAIGVAAAKKWFESREKRRLYLYEYALDRWGVTGNDLDLDATVPHRRRNRTAPS